jgi:putative membrane protein
MKKNSQVPSFSTPQRQSYVAILLIIWKTYKIVFRQALPFLVVLLFGKSSLKADYLVWVIIGIAIISMIVSIINFFKFTYHIANDELIINKGIFRRKKISIDIDRVQTINLEQNIVHNLFNVVRLKADTAGSDKDEFSLDAVRKDTAEAFKDIVLRAKRNTKHSDPHSEDKVATFEQNKIIMSITPLELLKAGMVENHIRSSGLIIAFISYVYFNLQEIGINLEDYKDQIPAISFGLIVILSLFILVAVVSFIISMVRMVLRYYDLKLIRSGKGFSYTAGLFTKRTSSALDSKIQKITWSDNLLKKLPAINDLFFIQATSEKADTKKSIKIPSCKSNHIQQVLSALYPDFDLSMIILNKISPLWLKRQLLIRIILGASLIIAFYFINKSLILVVLVASLVWILHAVLKFRKIRFGFSQEYFFIKGGMYADKHSVFPIYKLQSVKKLQTPYMRRNGVVSLTFYHASGRSTIPYIPKDRADMIYDYTLMKIESSKKRWM